MRLFGPRFMDPRQRSCTSNQASEHGFLAPRPTDGVPNINWSLYYISAYHDLTEAAAGTDRDWLVGAVNKWRDNHSTGRTNTIQI